MNHIHEFENILSECLDRMLQGESVEQCLEAHPEQARELEPLLRTAQVAKIAATMQPRSEFRAQARREFQSSLGVMTAKKSQRSSLFSWHWQWQSGWAIALIAILIIVLAGGGTVIASGNSMPDNTLYVVKLAAEKVHMAFTFSEISKAELNAEFADKRVEEIIYLASRGDPQNVQIVAQRLNSNLVAINNMVGENNTKGPELAPGAVDITRNAPSQAGGNSSVINSPENTAPSKGLATDITPAAASIASAMVLPPSVTSSAPLLNVPVPAALAPTPMFTMAAPLSAQDTRDVSGFGLANSSPEPVSSPTLSGEGNSQRNTEAKNTELEKLKQTISFKAENNRIRLEEALGTASPEVRPALRQALAQAMAEYDKAIKIIDNSMNAEK
jgi:hypothetical protein